MNKMIIHRLLNENLRHIIKHSKLCTQNSLLGVFAFLLFAMGATAQTTVSLPSVADARIDQSGSSTNYATLDNITTHPWSPSYSRRSVIKFDLSSIPAGATITSATLKLTETGTYGYARVINVHRINNAWSESTVTWNNPTPGGNFQSTPTASLNVTWTGLFKQDAWNVTTDVQGIVNGTFVNNGWLLKDNVEDASQKYWQFASKENSNASWRPVLEVTYTNAITVNVTPASATICAGANTSLTASGATTYSWSPSTGLSSTTGATVTASPSTTTTYTVTGTGSGGATATKTVTVTVNSNPTVSIAPNTAAFCAGGSIQLTASGAATYSWSPATGLSSVTGASVSASPSSSTTYTVTGIDANGCAATATKIVTVNALPTVSVSPTTAAFCAGGSIQLTASGAATYSWSPATGLSSVTGATVSASPSSSTTYTVTATDANGCVNTATKLVTVNSLPTISISPSSSTIVSGNSVQLTASGASTYAWSPSTGLSATSGATVSASPTSSTSYTVTATDANGCVNTSSVQVTVVNPTLEWSELNGMNWVSPTLAKTTANDYNNGSAFSKNHLNANQDGWVEFTIKGNFHDYFGYAIKNYSSYNNDLRYGFEFANGIAVMHKGSRYTMGYAAINDKLKIERVGSTINYYKNDVLLISLPAPTSNEELFIDLSNYAISTTQEVRASFTADFNVCATINDNNPAAASRDGSISLDPLNEKGVVTYLWSNGATTSSISGLTSGTYSVTVTDAGGQSINRTYTLLNKPVWTNLKNMNALADARLTKTTPTNSNDERGNAMSKVFLPANQDGYIEFLATDNGESQLYFGFSSVPTDFSGAYYSYSDIDYSFWWYGAYCYITEGGGNVFNTSTVLRTSKLRIAREGSFIVYYIEGIEVKRTATDANQDLFVKFCQVGQANQGIIRTSFGGGITPSYILQDNNPTTAANGSITVEAMGGKAPYNYLWSNGATTASVSNLAPALYTLTITDADNISSSKTFKVMNKVAWKNLTGVTLQSNDRLIKTDQNDNNNSGWGSSRSYLPAGQDGELIINTTTVPNNSIIGFSAHPILFKPDFTGNLINYGGFFGGNYFHVYEGGGEITYNSKLYGGNEFRIARETNAQTGVTTIAYYLNGQELRRVPTQLNQDLFVLFSMRTPNFDFGRIRASFGHTLQASYEITDNDPMQTPSGAIAAEGLGGTPPYTYAWSNGATTQTISNISAGNYTLTLTDALGQTTQKTFNVANKAAWINFNKLTPGSDGYLLKDGTNNDGWATSANFIPAGEEGFMEYIGFGRVALSVGLSKDPFVFTPNVSSDITYGVFLWNYTRVIYHGYWTEGLDAPSQGGDLYRVERKINAQTGKTEMIYYLNGVEKNRLPVDISEDLYLKVMVQNAHSNLGYVRLSHGHQFNASVTITHRDISLSANGAINLEVIGGKAPYTYLWSNGATTQDISGLKKGSYTVTVTSADNQSINKTFKVLNKVTWEDASGISIVDNLTNASTNNAHARSKNYLAPNQDGKVTFSMSASGAGWFGFSTSENVNSASDFNYGFFSWNAYVWNIVNGLQGTWHSQYSWNGRYFQTGDVATIERIGNQMIYTYEGIEIARLTVDPSQKLYVASLTQGASGQIFRALCDFGEGIQNKVVTGSYATLQKQLDNKYYSVSNNKLSFIYDEEYEVGDDNQLTYTIYNQDREIVLKSIDFPITIQRGLNKIDIDCISQKINATGYFILEIQNSKNDKWYLRFELSAIGNCN